MACLFMWAPERHPAAPCMECSTAPLLWSTLKRKPSSECFLSPRGEYEVYYRFEYPVACFFCSRRFLQSKSTDRIASCSSRADHRRRQSEDRPRGEAQQESRLRGHRQRALRPGQHVDALRGCQSCALRSREAVRERWHSLAVSHLPSAVTDGRRLIAVGSDVTYGEFIDTNSPDNITLRVRVVSGIESGQGSKDVHNL